MSCRRAYDIDLAAFLADPRSAAHGDFRVHYPRCAECAAEVRAWTEVEGLLRAAETHPAPAKLLALEEERSALAPVERAALEEHVARCPSCRDEIVALRGFQPEATPAAAPAREPGASALGALRDGLRRLLVQPAFAYTLALLFAAPTVYRLVTAESELLQGARVESAAEPREMRATDEAQAKPPSQARADRAKTPEFERKQVPAVTGEPAGREPARAEPGLALRDRAEADAPAPESVPLPKKETLRALGYTLGESVEEPRRARRTDDDARSARSADHAVATDALASRASEAAAAPRPVLEPSGTGLYRLRVPLEPGMGDVEVRVSPPGEGRLLAEHFRGASGEVSLEIPAAWVAPGTWRIERRALGRRDVFTLEVPPAD